VEGIRTFNGDGTGTLSGTSVYVVPPPGPGPAGTYPSFGPSAGSVTFSASFTYTVNSDGTFAVKLVPGTFSQTYVTGGRAGETATIDTIPLTGLIGENAKVLTLASVDPTIETTTYSNGDVWPSICHRSRVLVKMDKGDRGDN
jgi:hypothetical protein